MYDFVDTIEHVNGVGALPAEALSINGKYIEHEIEGYRTLYVTGRELLESEIQEKQIGYTDGAEFQGKRNISRVITVTYRLMARTPEDFRVKFNVLNLLLDQEQAKLLFCDEPDKYFIGTKSTIDEIPGGLLNVIGSFDFYCADPYKYSAVEKTFQAVPNSNAVLEAKIVNNGTESVPIDYTIEHNHENGYIGIISEHGAIQLGKVNEADGETYIGSTTLTNSTASNKWSGDAKWVDDKGTNGQNANNKTQGTFGVKAVSGNNVLTLATKGTAEAGKWNGAMKTFTVTSGAKDFYAYSNSWFEGTAGQTGCQTMAFLDSNNKCICYQSIWKSDTDGNKAHMAWGVGGNNPKKVDEKIFTVANDMTNNPFTTLGGHSDIRKEGSKITFYWWGKYFSVVVPELASVKVAKVQLYIGQVGTRNLSSQYLTRNYFRKVNLRILNVSKWRDVPNRYQENDTVFVDGSAAKVYVNGMVRMEDEILGSTYFKAPPGETKVQFHYSDFADPVPTIKAKIREAYL